MIYPVPGEHDWTKTPGLDIEPPEFKVKRGRKKEKRIKVKFEVPKPKDTSRMGTTTCGNCGLQGHRYSNVDGATATDPTPPPRSSNLAPTPPPRASNPSPTTTTTTT
ncbi:hypothetical protein D1007_41892 [Hordeum vulgare]|nr:hypothetical protein D1007_41892 [Hordeum vulgare]